MKTLYLGEIRRGVDGDYWIDDTKFDWKTVSEIQMSMYLGSLFGATVEHLRMSKITGSLFIEVKVDDEVGKEVQND